MGDLTPTGQLDAVLERLDNPRQRGDKWESHCPAHPDGNPSFGVWLGDNGAVIVDCRAGCSKDEILAALNMKWSDLFPQEKRTTNGNGGSRIVATYPYVDEAGVLLYEVVRYDPKDFRQRRPDGHGGWIWKLGDTRRVLYRLPGVIEAVASGTPILIAEGEKDADALEAAGYAATTCPQGAGKWRPEYTAVLAGADVVIVADRDKAGRAHARAVAEAVGKVAASIQCVEPAAGKDVSDHLGGGLDVEHLELIEDRWVAPDQVDEHADDDADGDGVHASLHPVDLAPVLDGTVAQPVPEYLTRDDGGSLFYGGSVNSIHGDSGAGKGWVVCQLIRDNARRGQRTMLVDFEDTAQSVTARLRLLGMSAREVTTWLVYIRPQVALGPRAVDHLCRTVNDLRVAAVVVDSIGEAFALEGINEDRDNEVGPWFRRVARPLADTGAAVVLVDHSTKASDSPLHPSGSKRKRAAVTGASYLVEAVQPFVKGRGGRLRITAAKDRHGSYRRGEKVADLVMDTDASGTVHLTVYAPTEHVVEADLAVELAARAAVAAAKAEGQPISQAALVGLMNIKASTDTKRGGIDLAVARDLLREDRGARNARMFTYVNDGSDTTNNPPRLTSPDLASGEVPIPHLDLASSPPSIDGARTRSGRLAETTTDNTPRPGEVITS